MDAPLDIPGLSFVSLQCQSGNDVNPCAQWVDISERVENSKFKVQNSRLNSASADNADNTDKNFIL